MGGISDPLPLPDETTLREIQGLSRRRLEELDVAVAKMIEENERLPAPPNASADDPLPNS
jgi:hypothetical protein